MHNEGMRRLVAIALSLTYVSAKLACGQDADTIVLKDEKRKFTIVSQIQDPAEAAAFLAALDAPDSKSRNALANQFLNRYPRSWLLAQASDLAARSAVDREQYPEAVEKARFSLRLLPENPSLLVLLANIEAQQADYDQAVRDADLALEYLDEIERPSGMNQTEWNALRLQLKSSAYFARARVEASQALRKQPADKDRLARSLASLNRAAAWNSKDDEVLYLRGIVELQLQQPRAAAADLAFVWRSGGPMGQKAEVILRRLAKGSVEDFVSGLPPRVIDASLTHEAQRNGDSQALTNGYVGPEACRTCHAKEYNAWRTTGMARMLQPYRPENVVGDFSANASFESTIQPGSIQVGFDKKPFFRFANNQRFNVDYTIGSKWQQGYATKLPDGRLQVLPVEYNLQEKKWINYWQMIDPPGSARAVIEDFPKLTAATNYQQNCAICHTSQLKIDESAEDSFEHGTYLQPGIDCEMCHGPSAWHVKQIGKGSLEHTDPKQPPFDFRRVSNRDAVRVCAQCHRQSAVRDIGAGGELNYSSKGDFVPTTWLRSYDAFSRKAFYKDGRFRETTFIVEAFTRSACYLRGTAQCASCHSPHLDNFATNETSLKYLKNPNEMCLQCHEKYRNRVAEHSRHEAGGEASRCVTCHMPRIAEALLFKARSHQIEAPTADLTERFGQQESPNVCVSCHSEKAVGWAKEQLARWQR